MLLKRIAIFLIRIYRYTLSNYVGTSCRFYPTCSKYALQAFENFGACHGLWLTCKRVAKCHPWCEGGYDPVPDNLEKQ